MEKKKKDVSPAQAAAAAGGAVVGGNVARHNLMHLYRHRQEGKVRPHLTHKTIQGKLKPGDIFFSRSPRKEDQEAILDLPEATSDTPISKHKIVKKINKKLPRFLEQDLIRGYGGHPLYHAGIYEGRGKVIHAPDEDVGVDREHLKDVHKHYSETKFYRPNSSPEEKKKALEFARAQLGKNYNDRSWITGEMAKELLGKRRLTGKKKCNDFVCTTLVTESYPKKFKHHWMQPAEMLDQGGMQFVGALRKKKMDKIHPAERLMSHGVQPILRSAKYAIPAAGLAYATKKVMDMRNKKKQS